MLLFIISQLVNGSFENGMTGWSLSTYSGCPIYYTFAEPRQASDVSPSISPTHGSYFLHISTLSQDIDGSCSTSNVDGNSCSEYDYAVVSQTFNAAQCNQGIVISFDFHYLTAEWSDPNTCYDDLFRLKVNNNDLVKYSNPRVVTSPWPDYHPVDNVYTTVYGSSVPTQYYTYGKAIIGWNTITVNYPTPGTYTIMFENWDQGDEIVANGVLIDRVQVNCLTPVSVPEKPIVNFSKGYIYVNYIPENSSVEIYLPNGQLIHKLHYNAQGDLKVQIYKSGTYIVKVKSKNKEWTYKGVVR